MNTPRPSRSRIARAAVCVSLLAAAAGCLASAACTRPKHVELCVLESRAGSLLSADEIRLARGTVIALKATPVLTVPDKIMNENTLVTLRTSQPTVLGIEPLDPGRTHNCVAGDEDDPQWYFVIYGHSAGTTTLEVDINGERVHTIPVTVTP